jgi:hypothetical protein
MFPFPDSVPATNVLQALVADAAIILSASFVRRRYFSPLSDIPGPFFASFSASLWHLWQIWKGHVEAAVIEQHRKHGSSVSTPGPYDRDRPTADGEY